MKKAADRSAGPQINDQIRFAPGDPEKAAEPSFRIVSAYRTPSAILFQRTTDIRNFKRSFPDGLEVSIALGSGFARKELKDSQKEGLLQVIDSCRTHFEGRSLYLQYLTALKTLVDEPERDAPDFMKNGAWEIKSCNTVLSGWAQLRHTWALQAKQTILYLGLTIVPEGFVEPEPEFFSRMSELAVNTRNMLEESGAFEPDYDGVICSLERFRDVLDGVKSEEGFWNKVSALPHEDMISLELPSMLMMEMNATKADRDSEAFYEEARQWMATLVTDLREGQIDKHPRLRNMLGQYDFDLEDLWDRFERVSRRLEAISHKQLRQVDLDESEVAFIKGYGETIAGIMLYGGNSYLTPKDDAPRVVDVYANPQGGGYLHVGIARSRKIYVLYPWKGMTVLCEGAVMPYYEFVTTTRLTDESWRKELDSKDRPSIPKWMSPAVNGGDLTKPSLKDED